MEADVGCDAWGCDEGQTGLDCVTTANDSPQYSMAVRPSSALVKIKPAFPKTSVCRRCTVVTGGVTAGKHGEPSGVMPLAHIFTHPSKHVSFEVLAVGILSTAYLQAMPCRTNRTMLEREQLRDCT